MKYRANHVAVSGKNGSGKADNRYKDSEVRSGIQRVKEKMARSEVREIMRPEHLGLYTLW